MRLYHLKPQHVYGIFGFVWAAPPRRSHPLHYAPSVKRTGDPERRGRCLDHELSRQEDMQRSKAVACAWSCVQPFRGRRSRYSARGIGFSGGGSTPNELAVRHVMEKLPVNATSATRLSSPIVFSALA